jgi:carbon monoxide dehydrogenase subunit G
MVRYSITVHSPRPADDVFAYLSRFSSAAEWDPGVSSAVDVDGDPVRVGSRFDLHVQFLGRTLPLRYTVTELEAPGTVTVEAANRFVRSRDRITVEPEGGGSVVRYDAMLEPLGVATAAGPLLSLAFVRIGRRAEASLRSVLGAEAPSTVP